MELRGILMPSPGEREVHHYPPTTAEWVASPLLEQDDLERNPLEPAPEVKPGVRLGAVLIIISGILALAGLIVQLYQANVISLVGWSLFRGFGLTTIGFPMVTMIFPMAFAVGGVVRGITLRASVTRRSVVQVIQFASTGLFLQLLTIPLAFIQIVAAGSRSGQTIGDLLGPANWLAWASFLIMLAAAWFIRIVVKPPATQEDVKDIARFQHLVDLNRNGGDSRRKITFFRGR
jgi:hypothetical protein